MWRSVRSVSYTHLDVYKRQKLDGSTITGYAQLQDTLSYYSSGETVPITVQRMEGSEYVEKTFDVTLSSGKEAGVEQDK